MEIDNINIVLQETVIYFTKMFLLAIPFTLIAYAMIHVVSIYYTPNHLPGFTVENPEYTLDIDINF